MRKIVFSNGEYYHIYNRGVDKREIFSDEYDWARFFQSMKEFNVMDPIGSIYENSFREKELGNLVSKSDKLVDFICYCLNPNHYHFLLMQRVDKGVEKFMHRLALGYTKYFNQKHERSGSLFQGVFKATHVDLNEYILHLSAYINLNNKVHQLGNLVSKSSWGEYAGEEDNSFCEKDIILGQFKNKKEYKNFAEDSLKDIQKRKELKELLFD